MVEGGGPRDRGFWGGSACAGYHVAVSGNDPQGERGLPWYWPRGGDVLGTSGNFKSLY